jgi:ERCC4-type nuclease
VRNEPAAAGEDVADQPEITVLQDSREQKPYAFGELKVEIVALRVGDYSCVADGTDLRDVVAIERKSISDLLGCIGGQRERFERELTRLAQIPFRAIVIEGTIPDLLEATHESKLHPRAVMGSVLAWTFKYGTPPIFCSARTYAAAAVRTLLMHGARYAAMMAEADEAEATISPGLAALDKILLKNIQPLRWALASVSRTFTNGRNSHPDNDWQQLSATEHIARAAEHLRQLEAGDTTEDHVAHCATRLLMALEVRPPIKRDGR